MKILRTVTLCALFSVVIQGASAQISREASNLQVASKPKLFKDAPARIALKQNEFDKLFLYEVGQVTSLSLSRNFSLAGTVVSKAEDRKANVKSIVVRCSDKPGASFTLSRTINENNTITYRGRMISFKHSDAYEMVFENDSYSLIKKEASDLYEE
ncbi:MAG TPA: hypothetical protein VM935_00490 [Chitinophagaceae bacterium]|nr:hypothetical protein [Chitinophagaceae bacterium]